MKVRIRLLYVASALVLVSHSIGVPLTHHAGVAAAPPEYSVSTAHPRILLTPERLVVLKAYAARNGGLGTSRWQNVLTRAKTVRTGVTAGTIDPLGDLGNYETLAMAYQVTGDATFARAAITLLTQLAVDANTLEHSGSSGHFYAYRSLLLSAVLGYDWCYDQMTVAERQQVATWLMDRADGVWPETNPAQVNGWAVSNPANNFFYGFLMTWVAALAVAGDGTDTKVGVVSGVDRAKYHIDLGLSKFDTLVRPWAASWGKGGIFAESTNYDSAGRLGTVLLAHRTATGQDYINDPSFPFLRESLAWRIYGSDPTQHFQYHLGDQTRVADAPLSAYDRHRALVVAASLQDATLQGQTKSWLDTMSPPLSSWSQSVTWEFLYYDEDLPTVDYRQSYPTSFYAPGSGLLTQRSSWSSDATYWGIWAGPMKESHQDGNVNGFLIWKGSSWLVGNATMYGYGGSAYATGKNNNLTFGSYAQVRQPPSTKWPEEAGRVLVHEVTGDYTLFEGWGTQAYVQDRGHDGFNNNQKVVNDYVRKFVYLAGSDTFLVYDRTETVDPTVPKQWHLHSKGPITVNGRTYQFDNGQYRLWGESLLPETGTSVTAVPQNYAKDGTLSSNRVDVVTSRGVARDYLLNVLQVAPVTQTSVASPTALIALTGNAEGVAVGNWVVLFGKTERLSGTVQYRIAAAQSTEHLVTDLVPNAPYLITLGSGQGITAPATTNGSLRFTAPAGTELIMIAQAATATDAAIVLTTSADRTSVQVGTALTYSLTYQNVGGKAATFVQVIVPVPVSAEYVNGSVTGGGEYNSAQRTLRWNFSTVPAGGSGTVTYQVKAL